MFAIWVAGEDTVASSTACQFLLFFLVLLDLSVFNPQPSKIHKLISGFCLHFSMTSFTI